MQVMTAGTVCPINKDAAIVNTPNAISITIWSGNNLINSVISPKLVLINIKLHTITTKNANKYNTKTKIEITAIFANKKIFFFPSKIQIFLYNHF